MPNDTTGTEVTQAPQAPSDTEQMLLAFLEEIDKKVEDLSQKVDALEAAHTQVRTDMQNQFQAHSQKLEQAKSDISDGLKKEIKSYLYGGQ